MVSVADRVVDVLVYREITPFQGIYKDLHTTACIIGGAFAVIALVVSLLTILHHLRAYTNPEEQKWIIGILFMVPVYASESIISLWKSQFSLVCDILRNCYEAFALYCFGSYLVACLEMAIQLLENDAQKENREQLIKMEEDKKAQRKSTTYDFFCQPNLLGEELYNIVKFGLVQYMIMKTLCSFLALVLELFGVYGDGEFKWYYGYPYIALIINFSQSWALYCLVQFYNVIHHKLQSIKPLAKFISFKAIVFATWWQGVGIALICYFGFLPKEEKFQDAIQNFLICIEMAIAAVAHVFVFPVEPYRYLPIPTCRKITSTETKTSFKVDDGDEGKSLHVEEKEKHIEAPGTSVRESVQDVVLGGGEHVVKDVVLTISQAIEPVEKGVTRIQEKFYDISVGSNEEDEPTVKVHEHVREELIEDEEQSVVNKKGRNMFVIWGLRINTLM